MAEEITPLDLQSESTVTSESPDEEIDSGLFTRRQAIHAGALGFLALCLSGCNDKGTATEFGFSIKRTPSLTPQQEAEEYLKVFERLREEANDLRYSFPENEKETGIFAQHIRQKGEKIRVPTTLGKKKDGTLVITKFSEPMSYGDFLRWKLQTNIYYLRRRISHLRRIIEFYKQKIQETREQLRGNLKNTMNSADIALLERKINEMWHNWEFEYRDRRGSTQSERARERILEEQRKWISAREAKPLQITAQRSHIDLLEVERTIDGAMLSGDPVKMVAKTTPFNGEGTKLIDAYEEEVAHVTNQYIKPLEARVAANEHWLSKTEETK